MILWWLACRQEVYAGAVALDLELLARFDAIVMADLGRQHDLAFR